MSSTIVLVHGAWHGAWCWDRVVPRLHQRGLDVVAVELPGHGADVRPFADLHGDADAVRAALDLVAGDALLVGHSYGGAVVTEAGAHPAVTRLVYLAAFALDRDESCAATLPDDAEAQAISHAGRPDVGAAIVFAEDGTSTLAPDGAAECLYNECDPATVDWAVAHLGAQPMLNLTQSPAAIAWRDRPTTYVVCDHDQIVHPDLQRLMARRCGQVETWPLDHSPFLSDPARMATLLAELAGP